MRTLLRIGARAYFLPRLPAFTSFGGSGSRGAAVLRVTVLMKVAPTFCWVDVDVDAAVRCLRKLRLT
jgi:hypothetical protein